MGGGFGLQGLRVYQFTVIFFKDGVLGLASWSLVEAVGIFAQMSLNPKP